MKLIELDAHFVGHYTDRDAQRSYRRVRTLRQAQGVMFQCPKCAEGKVHVASRAGRRGFARGAHYVICWFRNPREWPPVPDTAEPGPGRWWVEASSTGLADLTFGHGEPSLPKSVLLTGGCGWHGFVTNGDAA